MRKIDQRKYRKSIARLSEILSGMAKHADRQSTWRCPYKNRLNQCTAQFGCRNQRKPAAAGDPLLCLSDDKLDYRKAWETIE